MRHILCKTPSTRAVSGRDLWPIPCSKTQVLEARAAIVEIRRTWAVGVTDVFLDAQEYKNAGIGAVEGGAERGSRADGPPGQLLWCGPLAGGASQRGRFRSQERLDLVA